MPIFETEKDKNILGKIFVDDKNGNYIYQQNLNIFNNSFYQNKNKIAPGISNTYYFVIHNNTDSNMNYNILMYEENKHNINIKYRLKKNNQYLIGSETEWVNADKLKTTPFIINSSSSDSYALDWKWFDSNNDNDIGKNINTKYKLNIRIYFESAN